MPPAIPKYYNMMLVLCSEQGWNLENVLKERIVLIDGAMGTMVQREGLEEEDFRYKENQGSLQRRIKGGWEGYLHHL